MQGIYLFPLAAFTIFWWAAFLFPLQKDVDIPLSENPSSFYAQSFISASILHDTAKEKLRAIPSGFRRFASIPFEPIPEEIDLAKGERLLIKKPDLAFIAPYTHPQMVARLKAYQIPTFSFAPPQDTKLFYKQLHQLENITGEKSLKGLAEKVQNIHEELFNLLEMTLKILNRKPRIVLLDYSGQPSFFPRTLFWHNFIDTFTINPKEEKPFTLEWLANSKSDAIIILSSQKSSVRKLSSLQPKLFQKKKIYFIPRAEADFPSHIQLLSLYKFATVFLQCAASFS